MTVQELIDQLSGLPRDMRIIMGSDDEGNDFVNPYSPDVSWCIEDDSVRCGYRPVHDSDVGTEYDEDDLVRMVVM